MIWSGPPGDDLRQALGRIHRYDGADQSEPTRALPLAQRRISEALREH